MKKRYISIRPYLSWRNTPAPVDWTAIFGRRAPLELEIGCGNGEALARRAAEHPERDFVALDLNWPSVTRALRRVNQAGLANTRLVKGGADTILWRMFAPGALSHVWCLFPCPWPKEKHEHKRLFGTPFLRLLNSRLAPGACFTLVTDWEQFAEWVAAQVPGSGFELGQRLIGPGFDTKYERRWREGGQNEFFELVMTKAEHAPVGPFEELPLRTPILKQFDPADLGEFEVVADSTVVRCRDAFFDPQRQVALLRMIAIEEGFSQNFYIQVGLRDDNLWQVRVAPGCGVVPIVSVQQALDVVAERLGGER